MIGMDDSAATTWQVLARHRMASRARVIVWQMLKSLRGAITLKLSAMRALLRMCIALAAVAIEAAAASAFAQHALQFRDDMPENVWTTLPSTTRPVRAIRSGPTGIVVGRFDWLGEQRLIYVGGSRKHCEKESKGCQPRAEVFIWELGREPQSIAVASHMCLDIFASHLLLYGFGDRPRLLVSEREIADRFGVTVDAIRIQPSGEIPANARGVRRSMGGLNKFTCRHQASAAMQTGSLVMDLHPMHGRLVTRWQWKEGQGDLIPLRFEAVDGRVSDERTLQYSAIWDAATVYSYFDRTYYSNDMRYRGPSLRDEHDVLRYTKPFWRETDCRPQWRVDVAAVTLTKVCIPFLENGADIIAVRGGSWATARETFRRGPTDGVHWLDHKTGFYTYILAARLSIAEFGRTGTNSVSPSGCRAAVAIDLPESNKPRAANYHHIVVLDVCQSPLAQAR